MENGIKKAMLTLMEESFSQEEIKKLSKMLNEIPEELLSTITQINSLYFKKGFASGIEFRKYLEI